MRFVWNVLNSFERMLLLFDTVEQHEKDRETERLSTSTKHHFGLLLIINFLSFINNPKGSVCWMYSTDDIFLPQYHLNLHLLMYELNADDIAKMFTIYSPLLHQYEWTRCIKIQKNYSWTWTALKYLQIIRLYPFDGVEVNNFICSYNTYVFRSSKIVFSLSMYLPHVTDWLNELLLEINMS